MERFLPTRSPEHRAALQARERDKEDAGPPANLADAWRFDYRDRAMHDRDKVLYSEAFQRLAQITQVTASESGYVFHNRLGHSLKVAQIGRRLTERLQAIVKQKYITGAAARAIDALSPDAVEAGCLAHDLGHPPFGHVAEQELQELTGPTQGACGRAARGLPGLFEGNAQSFRIVTRLEQASGGQGFNLTRQTLETLLKYPWRRAEVNDGTDRGRKWGYYETEASSFDWVHQFAPVPAGARGVRSLEAEIMDWADDLTYAVHDVEDFYRAGLIPLHLFASTVPLPGRSVRADALKQFVATMEDVNRGKGTPTFTPDQLADAVEDIVDLGRDAPIAPYDGSEVQRRQLHRFGSALITEFLSAFTLETRGNQVVLCIDDMAHQRVEALKALVHAFVIQRPSMAEVQHGQRGIVADLFEHYLSAVEGPAGDRRTLPYAYRQRLDRDCGSTDDRMRLVVDLVSELTEESAYRIHHRLTGRMRTSALV